MADDPNVNGQWFSPARGAKRVDESRCAPLTMTAVHGRLDANGAG